MKAMYKYELAERAGVSTSTFQKWLRDLRPELEKLGIKPTAKLIPPAGVKIIVDYYCIDLQQSNR